MAKINITDTGLDEVNGNSVYNQVNNGSAIELPGFKLDFKFPVSTTEHQSTTLDSNNDLTFMNNEVSGLVSPKITLKGIVHTNDTALIRNILTLRKTQGIKALSGGLGVLDALPDATQTTPQQIYVIIKEVAINETLRNSTNTADITINLEQVR